MDCPGVLIQAVKGILLSGLVNSPKDVLSRWLCACRLPYPTPSHSPG